MLGLGAVPQVWGRGGTFRRRPAPSQPPLEGLKPRPRSPGLGPGVEMAPARRLCRRVRLGARGTGREAEQRLSGLEHAELWLCGGMLQRILFILPQLRGTQHSPPRNLHRCLRVANNQHRLRSCRASLGTAAAERRARILERCRRQVRHRSHHLQPAQPRAQGHSTPSSTQHSQTRVALAQ